jgi:ABC-2 type transport system permease protein
MNTFPTLLKREFWEHKGGFFWAPVVASSVFLLFSLMAVITAEVIGKKTGVQINGIHLNALTEKLGPDALTKLSLGLDVSFFMAATWAYVTLAFVVFFYCLGTLFDERKDRSVLFWKSLPVSDRDTVLAKVASALVIAPVIATLTGIAAGFGFFILLSVVVLFHGGNPIALIWGPANPLEVTAALVASLPVYAVWALPTVGWLMLCSAWARSKPFLWALVIPVLSGVLVSWFDVMQLFSLKTGWFWGHVVARLLGSALPGADILFRGDSEMFERMNGPEDMASLFSAGYAWAGLASVEVWIWAAIGAAMIAAAIRLRRWRDDA